LLQARLDVKTIGCSSQSAAVPADAILLSFCLLSCTLVFHPIAIGTASVPGLDSNEFPAWRKTQSEKEMDSRNSI